MSYIRTIALGVIRYTCGQFSVNDLHDEITVLTKVLHDLTNNNLTITDLTNNIADFFKKFEELEKRFGAYESDTAVQKSIGEVDNSSRGTKLQKNMEFDWQGSFLGSANL